MIKKDDMAAARRRSNTIAEIVEGMRAAQRRERINPAPRPTPDARMWITQPKIGVWKGGCK